MATETIDKVQVEVEATAKGTSAVFQQLENQLKTIQRALGAIDTSQLQAVKQATQSMKLDSRGFTKEEREVIGSLDKIKQAFAGMEAYKNAALNGDTSSLTSFNRKAIHLQSDIDKLAERFKQLDDMMKGGNVDSAMFQVYREQLAEVQSALNSAQNDVSNFNTEASQGPSMDASAVISTLKAIGAEAKKVVKKLLEIGGKLVKAAINGVKTAFVKLKDAIGGVSKHTGALSKFFNTGFMKVLKYGFGIRSLYVGFRRLRKAVVESFEELQKSGAFYETTRANIESLKHSLALLKYQFGAAFEPIFNAVAPALQVFIDHVLKAMNAFSAFTAKLMGKDSYSRAVLATQAVEDNVGGAAKAAKELNKQLQGFDELNNLTSSNPSSGSGGSGDADSSGITYISESVDNVLGDFGKELAKNIKNGDWGAVGTAISDKLTEQLNGIKWANLKQKAANFGTNLGAFINGLITPEAFSAVGSTIGNAIVTALTGALTLGQTINWENVGTSVASGINAFVKTNPLALVVENFNTWANGILTALSTAVSTIEWKEIAQHIADAISNIDASGIGWNLGKLVNSLVNAFYTLVSNKDTWSNLGQKIADGINGFFKGMSEIDPKTGLTGFQAFAKSLTSVITGLADTISTALEEIDWEKVGQGINQIWDSIDWEQIKKSLTRLKNAIIKALKGLLKGLEIDASDIVITLAKVGLVIGAIGAISLAATITKAALTAAITGAITSLLTGGTAAAAGGTAVAGSGILVSLGTVAATIGGVTLAMAASATIGYTFGTTLGEFISQWLCNQGIISKQANDEYQTNAEMTFTQKVKDIKLAAEQGNLKKGWDAMWDDWMKPLFDEGKDVVIKVKSFAVKVKDKAISAKDAWNEFWGGLGEDAFNKVTHFKAAIDETKESINKKWENAGLKDKVVKVKASVKGAVKKVKSVVSALKKIKNKVFQIGATEMPGSKLGWISDTMDNIQKQWSYMMLHSSLKISASFDTTVTRDLKKAWEDIINATVYYKKKYRTSAEGGSYYGGSWHDIPQYASGTLDALKHGTIFAAGEAGPEVVGHINGRTEVLNRSQIASTMFQAITNGMRQFKNAQMVQPPRLAYANSGVADYNGATHNNNEALMAQLIAETAEQNRLLQIIANKNVTISSKDVFNATRTESNNYYNRTGNSPFLY